MNQKNLAWLVLALIVLGGIFFMVKPQYEPRARGNSALFGDVQGEKIAKIKIEQGKDSVELERKDDHWVVPARGGYPADSGKIRALLLKILDISVSQKITDNVEKHQSLGVTEDAVKNGKARLTFFDQDNKPLPALFIGDLRKKKGESEFTPAVGQYVRRADQNDVFLIADPLSYGATVQNWLDTDLLNILPSKVLAAQKFKGASTEGAPEYVLKASGEKSEISPAPAANEAVDESSLSQVRSGLENLHITDVHKADDPAVSGLAFDSTVKYETANALVYTVSSAEKDSKSYIKISVTFDNELAKRLQQEHDEAAKQAAASSSSSGQTSSSSGVVSGNTPSASATSSSSSAGTALPPLQLSNADEAAKLQNRLAPWVFEIPSFTGKKFRTARTEIVKPKEQPKPDAAAQNSSPVPPSK